MTKQEQYEQAVATVCCAVTEAENWNPQHIFAAIETLRSTRVVVVESKSQEKRVTVQADGQREAAVALFESARERELELLAEGRIAGLRDVAEVIDHLVIDAVRAETVEKGEE